MARIAGVDLPREKRVEIGLTYIYGIGLTTSQKMLAEVGVNPDTRVKDLSETEISKLREYIEHNLKVSSWPSRPRTEHQTECPHPQGPEEDHRRQEESHEVIINYHFLNCARH